MIRRLPSERRAAFQSAPHVDLEGVADHCRCADDTPAARFGCIECGAPCCSECAVPLESVAYCRRCATALLGAAVLMKSGSFELH
jgi:hypothetical protein